MKAPIKVSEIHNGLLKINRQRALYYRKASEKIHELNWKTFFNTILTDGRKDESAQIHQITKPDPDIASGTVKKNKFYLFRMKVKTIISKGYELA